MCSFLHVLCLAFRATNLALRSRVARFARFARFAPICISTSAGVETVQTHPNNVLSVEDKNSFADINKKFTPIFSTKIGYSGNVIGDVLLENNASIPETKVPQSTIQRAIIYCKRTYQERCSNDMQKLALKTFIPSKKTRWKSSICN